MCHLRVGSTGLSIDLKKEFCLPQGCVIWGLDPLVSALISKRNSVYHRDVSFEGWISKRNSVYHRDVSFDGWIHWSLALISKRNSVYHRDVSFEDLIHWSLALIWIRILFTTGMCKWSWDLLTAQVLFSVIIVCIALENKVLVFNDKIASF